MNQNIFWDKKTKPAEIKKILQNENHSRFIEFAALLLSRTNEPKIIFNKFLSRELFLKYWRRIKKMMRKNRWNDQRIIYWNEIYQVLSKSLKIEKESPKEKSIIYEALKIGQKIREVRSQKGWGQKKLADKTGLSQQHISFLERGTLNFSLETLIKILKILNLEIKIQARDSKEMIQNISETHVA